MKQTTPKEALFTSAPVGRAVAALALCGCFFMVYAAIAGYGIKVFYYLIVYAIFMVVGNCFYRKRA